MKTSCRLVSVSIGENMPTTISKKAVVAPSGIAIIASQSDFKTQIILAVVLVAYLVAQTILDMQKQAKNP